LPEPTNPKPWRSALWHGPSGRLMPAPNGSAVSREL
jgi:hypothetical protein